MTFYPRLLRETQPARDAFLSIPLLERAPRGELALPTYTAFLTEAYHHVRQTVPLLMLCGARLPDRLDWLRTAVGRYIDEEMGHEAWILDDLRACGADAGAVRCGRPAPATELMVAYAYDTIQRGNPVGLFGMVLVLEGTSTRLASSTAGSLIHTLGLPPEAFRYLSSHGELDIGHMEFFAGLMNRLDDTGDQAAVTHCANMIYHLYGDIFRRLDAQDIQSWQLRACS